MPATATSDSDEPMMTRKRRRAAPNRNGEPFQQTAPDSLALVSTSSSELGDYSNGSNRLVVDAEPKPRSESNLGPDRGPRRHQRMTTEAKVGEDSRKRTAYTVGEAWEFDRILEVSRAYDGRLMYKIAWQPTWGRISDFESDDAIDAARWAVISTFGTEDWDAEYQVLGARNVADA
ncbi:casein kinase delta [Fusarium globosum]|uniref:Casein kinase delta n=1 Tax=Fusarium globosum TaxID=78864 RepID=A0A8H5UK90_9HYPO|nr:casein kinase delta [Fusarium globosum]